MIYLVAVFAIIAYVFDPPVQGLLATSGVAAIILGLVEKFPDFVSRLKATLERLPML